MRLHRRDWEDTLPGPRGFTFETVKRGLVKTYCRYDKTVCDPHAHRWGTGFFVGEETEHGPRFVVTADLNCGWKKQTILIRQGKNWGNARVAKRNGKLALLEIYSPMRFTLYDSNPNSLHLLGAKAAGRANAAVMIGYHQPLLELVGKYRPHMKHEHWAGWLRRVHVEPATIDQHRQLIVTFKEGMRGSPIFAEQGVIGMAMHWDYIHHRMAVAELSELADFLKGVTTGKESALAEV
jgi:hypothetical protein